MEKNEKSKNNKRAGMTSTTLVTIILLIAGFVILILVFTQISWIGQIDKEVCHQSVILRATMPDIAGAQELVPLKCKTTKNCITSGLVSGKCEEFDGLKGVKKVKVSDGDQIERFISQEIVDCWSMMGEGKVSLFSEHWAKYGIGGVYPTCVICSRIAFDKEKLEKAKIDLSGIDVLGYMLNHKPSGMDETYYKYLAGKSPAGLSIEDSIVIHNIKPGKDDEGNEIAVLGEEETIPLEKIKEDPELQTKELAILFVQISAPSSEQVIKRTAFATLGITLGSKFIAPKTTGRIIKTIGSSIIKHPVVAATVLIAGLGTQQIMVANNRAVTAGKCGDITTSKEGRDGCSAVRTVNYDVNEMKKYCSVIESIP